MWPPLVSTIHRTRLLCWSKCAGSSRPSSGLRWRRSAQNNLTCFYHVSLAAVERVHVPCCKGLIARLWNMQVTADAKFVDLGADSLDTVREGHVILPLSWQWLSHCCRAGWQCLLISCVCLHLVFVPLAEYPVELKRWSTLAGSCPWLHLIFVLMEVWKTLWRIVYGGMHMFVI